MRIGIGLHPDYKVPDTVEFARRVQRAGFSGVWIADSQDLFRDCFLTANAVALTCDSVDIAISVTYPVFRHPSILAGSTATLVGVARGRVVLGISAGETAGQTAGLKRTKIADMEAVLVRCRTFLDSPWQGPASTAEVVMAGTGPRSLGLAGRLADGAYPKIGCHSALIGWATDRIAEGAQARTLPGQRSSLLLFPVALADRAEDAYREVAGFAAATAEAVCEAVPLEIIPPDARDDVVALTEAAGQAQHANDNAQWLDNPGLLGDLPRRGFDLFCITCGDAAKLKQRIDEVNVDSLVIPLLTRRRDAQRDRLAAALVDAV